MTILTDVEEIKERFTDWYGFDTENDKEGVVTITCLVHESGEKWIWKKAGGFIAWCDKVNRAPAKNNRPVVICHNLEYDLINEFGPDGMADMGLNYLKGRLISARHGKITFYDSFNHFRMSLASLGEDLGIKKLEMDINSEEYVATDAWISLTSITKARDYIASLGGQLGATAGSSSVSVWRAMTDDAYVYGAIDNPWLRRGYYGGRTEIFMNEARGDIRGYDVNSMYPFCMLGEFPEYHVDDPKINCEKGMAEVILSVPIDFRVGPLVTRLENNRLSYPVGMFPGVWTYDEIRYAESLGCKVIKVIKAMGCDSLVRPFDDFINILYAKRKESTSPPERLMLKVVMNSLYGKIASKSMVTRTVSKYEMLKKKNRRIDEVTWINKSRGLLDFVTPPPPYVNVMWGSMVTANARILLTQHMMAVPPEKLIYVDTDSVFCVDHTMPESKELGGMKLDKQKQYMRVKQPKVYQLDNDFVAKGVPRPRADGENGLVIDYASEFFLEGHTQFQAPIRFRESLNSKRGVANQWVTKSKSLLKEFDGKPLKGHHYYPPVVGFQTDMFTDVDGLPVKKQKAVRTTKR